MAQDFNLTKTEVTVFNYFTYLQPSTRVARPTHIHSEMLK